MSSTPLELRRRRVRLIRRRVVGGATAIFMASTGWIFFELVSGHDPALARQTSTHAATGASVASTSPASNSSSNSSGRSSSSSDSPSAVTTRAS